jgi:hypothetical protein
VENGSPAIFALKVIGKDRKTKLNFLFIMDSKGHRIVVCDNGTGVRILTEFWAEIQAVTASIFDCTF